MNPPFLFLVTWAAILVSSCHFNPENVSPALSKYGRLRLLMTDDPFLFWNVSSVTVTINKIELKKKESREDDNDSTNMPVDSLDTDDSLSMGEHHHEHDPDSAMWITVLDSPMVINLSDLRNGITQELANDSIPAGTYSMIRLFISEANIMLKNGIDFDVKVPSGSESGFKVIIPSGLVVSGGSTAELLVDFNLSRSIVMLGPWDHPWGFHLKPVIRALDNNSCGKVEGFVMDSSTVAINGAYVWLADSEVVGSTVTEESGFYRLMGIPAGTYNLFAAKQGYDTTKIENIRVSRLGVTKIDLKLNPALP